MLSLFSPEIMPELTDPPTPKGLPIAKTTSPSSSFELSPKLIASSPFASILMIARSVFESSPTILALYSFWLSSMLTTISSLPSTTWLFVTI